MRIMSVLAATGAGAAVGWLCGLVPVWPVVRVAAAAIMGSVVGAVGVVFFVLLALNRSESGGFGAVSPGLLETVVLAVPALGLIAVVCFVVLQRLGGSSAGVATFGPTFFGGGTALVAALWMARGLTISGG